MKIFKVPFIFLFLVLPWVKDFAQLQEYCIPEIKIPHPRILLPGGEESLIKQSIATNPTWEKMNNAILQECDSIINLKILQRIQIGRRLLDKSRECLRRVFYLSYAYRMTGEEKYYLRAEKEMLNVSAFSDWNPPHFLDVAEMTMGMAIGYDWLFDRLSPGSRKIISEAIINKGLEPSFDGKNAWFLTSNHNWNQVCNAGMTFGALAIYEDSSELAKTIIERAIKTIRLPMKEYGPDGAYPEGYMYWDYGTSFNVMFISAIEKVFATDFGLCQVPGFLKTAGFLENMTGATGNCFNWGDCRQGTELNPAMFWFAGKTNDPSLLWFEKSQLQTGDYLKFTDDRLLPAIMIWNENRGLDKITAPVSKVWKGQGLNPVCLMRTSWTDPNGIFLGFKAGSASVNHAHMDIGSFVMESDGLRWASDLGLQEYESIESKGIELFGSSQDAQRWSIFRLNNYVHNTLTFDNQLQVVKGFAGIDRSSGNPGFTFAISDLSSVYENQVAGIKRGAGIVNSEFVVIRDEIKGGIKPTEVRWTMLTEADVEITGKNTMTLTKNGKKLYLKVNSPAEITLKTWSTKPATNYDAPNPGTILVGFTCTIPANKNANLQVLLIPGSAKSDRFDFKKSLNEW